MSRSTRKTNTMDSALCIDPYQPAQSAQSNPGRHILPQGDRELIAETEKCTGGGKCLSGLACVACLCWSGWIILYKVHNVGFLAGRHICWCLRFLDELSWTQRLSYLNPSPFPRGWHILTHLKQAYALEKTLWWKMRLSNFSFSNNVVNRMQYQLNSYFHI